MQLRLFLCAVLPENSLAIKYAVTIFGVKEENQALCLEEMNGSEV